LLNKKFLKEFAKEKGYPSLSKLIEIGVNDNYLKTDLSKLEMIRNPFVDIFYIFHFCH